RQNGVGERPEKEAITFVDFACAQLTVLAAVAAGGVILHVDDQQCRMARVDLDLTAQTGGHPPVSSNCASASASSRARRVAQAACPPGSAIRSWRISIST